MCRTILVDNSNRQKNKLLKGINAEEGIWDNTCQVAYPTQADFPKFYGLLKIYKKDISLRSTVSSRGTFTFRVATELARILRTLAGKSHHHTKNS